MGRPTPGDTPVTPDPEDLACIELVELVTDYLEDAVSPVVRGRIERHLGACDGCARYVDQIRQTIAASRRLTPEDVPAPVVDRLLAVFRASREEHPGD